MTLPDCVTKKQIVIQTAMMNVHEAIAAAAVPPARRADDAAAAASGRGGPRGMRASGDDDAAGVEVPGAVAPLVTWFIGDISAMAAVAPTALLQAKYSRDFEREADNYAATMLRANGISTEHLANILERLESVAGARGGSSIDYLSTQRIQRRRSGWNVCALVHAALHPLVADNLRRN